MANADWARTPPVPESGIVTLPAPPLRNDEISVVVPYIERVEECTARLQSMGVVVLFFEIIILVIALLMPFTARVGKIIMSNGVLGLVTQLVFICSVVLIAHFDFVKREGNSLWQEISDSIQSLQDRNSDTAEIRLRARVALRQFSEFSKLPLVPGANGPAIYVAFNFALALFSMFMMAQ